MGDRANVVIKNHDGSEVFLYTHWTGYELPTRVHAALAKEARWDDPAYLARIVFCAMVKDSMGETTGYGISATLGDNDSYPLIVLDSPTQMIRLEHKRDRSVKDSFTFQGFVADPKPLITAFRGVED